LCARMPGVPSRGVEGHWGPDRLGRRENQVRRSLVGLLAVVLGLSLIGASCGSDDDSSTKAAFIYLGPPGDAGWTWAQDQGRKAAAEATGAETAYVESVPEGTADFGNYVRDFIDQAST